MTIQAVLRALKKNPNQLIKNGDNIYSVNDYDQSLSTVRMYNGIPDSDYGNSWENGFAYASSQHSQRLSVTYQTVNDKNYELIDATDIVVSSQGIYGELRRYTEKFDEKNQYQPDKSVYGQALLKRGNELLKAMGSPCVLTFDRKGNYGNVDYVLTLADNEDQNWRFKSTRALYNLVKEMTKEEHDNQKRTMFEANKPDNIIVPKKVKINEFLERIQSSNKLWYLNSTNSWKHRKNKPAVRNWDNAPLHPVKLERDNYGGARTDRIASRNRVTNQLGLPECTGRTFYSLNIKDDGSGYFFADIVHSYGNEGDSIIVDGNEMLILVHEKTIPEPHEESSYIDAMCSPNRKTATSYNSICKTLNRRLSNFQEFVK